MRVYLCLPTCQPRSARCFSPASIGKIFQGRAHGVVPSVQIPEQGDDAHDLHDVGFAPVLAQALGEFRRDAVGHCCGRLRKGQRRLLGVGEVPALLEIPHVVQASLGGPEALGAEDRMGLAIQAAGDIARHIADQPFELRRYLAMAGHHRPVQSGERPRDLRMVGHRPHAVRDDAKGPLEELDLFQKLRIDLLLFKRSDDGHGPISSSGAKAGRGSEMPA